MDEVFFCITNVATFILLVLPGFFAKRKNMITSQHIDGLSSILVQFLWPAMVLDIMNSVKVSDKMIHIALYTGGSCAIIYLLSCVAALFYWKVRKIEKAVLGILAFSIVFNNTGFIGLPFIQAVLGKEAGFAASIVEVVNDFFIYTLGLLLIQYGKDGGKKWDFRAMLSPGFVSVILGLAIFLLDIPLPVCLGRALGYLGNATTAMAMFLIGAQLGEMKFGEVFRGKYIYEVVVFRLILVPAAFMAVLVLFLPENHLSNQVLVLMSCMPCATCQAIFARQYQLDYKLATACVMATTVMLIAFLPVWSVIATMVI